MFDNLFRRQIQHLFEAVVVSKRGFVFGDFPELPVEALDDVGGIYDSPYLGWICVKGAENIPVVLPAFDAGRVLFSAVPAANPTQGTVARSLFVAFCSHTLAETFISKIFRVFVGLRGIRHFT